MRKAERYLAVLLVGIAGLFALAVGRLFALRFESGDIYPAYSSLRADPLGTKVLYDSVASAGLSVRRNFRMPAKLTAGADATMLLLGMSPTPTLAMPAADADGLDRFVEGGGRLVVAFLPRRHAPSPTTRPSTKPAGPRPGRKPDEAELPKDRLADLTERWGFAWAAFASRGTRSERQAIRAPGAADPIAARGKLSWHTWLHFAKLDPSWRVVYHSRSEPAIIERSLGRGTIVLAADAFFASNEAMRRERHADALAWMIGSSRRVVFDETHLGVSEDPGVVTLARKYGLEGAFAALLLLAGLFVWKNATSLVPRRGRGGAEDGRWVLGRDSAAGLVNLLRRSTRRDDILRVCFEQWTKTLTPERRDLLRKAPRMRDVVEAQSRLPARQRDPVRAYRRLVEIVAERK
jgi:hypothetical protein